MRVTTLHHLHPPEDPNGPAFAPAIIERERDGDIISGTVQAGTHRTFPIRHGILDLLGNDPAPLSLGQRSNFVWPTTAFYEQVWRRRSLSLLAGEPFPIARELDLLNRWVRPEHGGLYVDVGTSHGLYARALAHQFLATGATGTVLALDISLPMLRHSGELIAQKGYTSIDRMRARAQALPLADSTAAGVVSGGTFNEMGAQGDAFREVRRVLAVDGTYFSMSLTAARTATGRRVQRALEWTLGLIFPAREATNALFASAGLTITDQELHGIILFTRAVSA